MIKITTSYHEKGKEEGIKIGEEKGRLEGKVEVVIKLLAKNLSIDEIVEITELRKEQVEKLMRQEN